MKKKLLLGVAALGLAGIISNFSPIVSNASENNTLVTNNEDDVSIISSVTDDDIKSYIKGKCETPDSKYYLYNMLVNCSKYSKSNKYHYYNLYNNQNSTLQSYNLAESFTFKTNNIYFINTFSLSSNDNQTWSATGTSANLNYFKNYAGSAENFFDDKTIYSNYSYVEKTNYYESSSTDEILNSIYNKWNNALSSILREQSYVEKSINGNQTAPIDFTNVKGTYVIIPKSDFTEEMYSSVSIMFNNTELLITEVPYEVDLQAPSVDYPSNYVINVDNMQSVDEILSHITVTDDTDSNPQIIIKSNTYKQEDKKTGTYEMIIYAEDSSGNKSPEYTINIIVSDVTAPVIKAPTNGIAVGNSKKLTESEILSYFTATDNYSSEENIILALSRNDYKGNETKTGERTIIVTATDEAGNYSTVMSSIKVIDDTNPTIIGSNKTQPNNVLLSQTDLLALFTANDDTSSPSNIAKKIITDNYSANYSKVGTYSVTCRATDEAGNYVDSTITISVIDKVNPTINNVTKETEYSNKITDFKSLFTYSDETTSKDNITFEIVSDEYTENYNKKGEYVVEVKVTDEAGNSSIGTLTITVIDSTAPIITAPENVEIGNSILFTIDNLKEKIVVIDGYDGKLTNYELIDENNYSTNYKTLGNYKFIIKASDSSGNSVTGTITLIVSDTTAPEIFYDSYFILVREGEELTREMIISYATQALGLEDGSSIVNISGEYDTTKAGVYEIALTLDNGDIEKFNINVSTEPKEEAKWSVKSFFSTNMDNWTDFTQWKAWSFVAWLSWCGIGLVALLVLKIVLSILKKRK